MLNYRINHTTILKDPETGKEIIPDVKEGQILTFGADILHKSPRNLTNLERLLFLLILCLNDAFLY